MIKTMSDAVKNVRIIGHRGWSEAAPENTLPSYILAGGESSYWGCECDIHETKDGHFILLHDDTLDDTTNAAELFAAQRRADGFVWAEDLTLAQIKTLRIKDREKSPRYRNVAKYGEVTVPTLEEYLDVCAQFGKVPVIEVKEMDAPEKYLNILRERGILSSVLMLSFGRNVLRELTSMAPEINMQLLFEEGVSLGERDLSAARALGCRGIDIHYSSVNNPIVKMAHMMGLEVNAWEANPNVTRERIERVLSCGVDYITVDKPIEK